MVFFCCCCLCAAILCFYAYAYVFVNIFPLDMEKALSELEATIDQMDHVCQKPLAKIKILSAFQNLLSEKEVLRAENLRLTQENG